MTKDVSKYVFGLAAIKTISEGIDGDKNSATYKHLVENETFEYGNMQILYYPLGSLKVSGKSSGAAPYRATWDRTKNLETVTGKIPDTIPLN